MTIRSREWLAMGGALLFLSAGPAPPAAAQEPAEEPRIEEELAEIEEIVVFARRREERLQDVPATVSVLSEPTLESARVERAEHIVALVPGVSIVDAAEVGDTQVNIRGINGARDAENSFAFIVDGVLLTNPAAFNREFLDLQQIEVLKGPQGALYGRNAAAGAVLVTTRKPGNEFEVRGRMAAANDDSYYSALSVGGPIIENDLFFRLSGDWRDTDGFWSNSFTGSNSVDDFQSYNINGRLVWEPSEALSLDTKLRYGVVEAASITFNPSFALPVLAGAFGAPAFFEDADDHNFVFQPNVDPDNDQESLEASLKLDYDLDWATLTGWAQYSEIDQNFLADGTSGSFGFFFNEPSCRATTASLNAAGVTLPSPQFLGNVPEPQLVILAFPDFFPEDAVGSLFGPYSPTTCDGYQYQERDQRDFSAELRLTSPSEQRLRWLAGLYYLNIGREVGVATGIDTGGHISNKLISDATEQLVLDRFDTDVFALFGELSYDLTEDLELSVALRYDREERDVANRVPVDRTTQFIDFTNDGVFTGGAPLNPGLNPEINPSGVIPDKDETFDQLQPKISATYDWGENLTLYGSWGIGFKSGGFNNQGSAATVDLFINDVLGTSVRINDEFSEETSSAFELGFKSTFCDDRISLNGALYRVDVDDMQFFEFFVGPFGLLRVVTNIDEVEITGGELELNVLLRPGVNLFGGLSIIDSEIDENKARPNTQGNEAPYTPDYELIAGLDWTLPLPDDIPLLGGWDFIGRVDYRVVGETWFHTVQDDNSPTIFEPLFNLVFDPDTSRFLTQANYGPHKRSTYDTLDLRVGVSSERFTITGFVRNLADEEYLEEVIPAPEFGGSFIHPAAERRAGVEISYAF